jgi:hypothetical protein
MSATLTPEEKTAYETRNKALEDLIHPFREADYTTDIPLNFIEQFVGDYTKNWNMNLDPDFQRGHVWNDAQRVAYMEFLLRGGQTGREVIFNHPHWHHHQPETDLPDEMQIVDGKQRMQAVRMFMRGEIKPFGLTVSDFDNTKFAANRSKYCLHFRIHTIPFRSDLLAFYIAFNETAVIHSREELDRVRGLLEASRKPTVAAGASEAPRIVEKVAARARMRP